MGTAVGTSVFNQHGWRAAAALSVGWQGFCLLVVLARGPHCSRYTWFGWQGGWATRKERPAPPRPEGKVGESSEGEHGVAEKFSNDNCQQAKSEKVGGDAIDIEEK